MFEAIADFISEQWDELKIFEVVPQTHKGIVLRLGKFHHAIKPGVVWKIPYIDELQLVMSIITTMGLPTQSLTTLDGKPIVIGCIVKFQVINPKPYLLKIYDSIDVLQDTTMGAVAQVIGDTNYCNLHEIREVVERIVKRETKGYGFKIHKITFTDLGPIKTIRLMQDNSGSSEED